MPREFRRAKGLVIFPAIPSQPKESPVSNNHTAQRPNRRTYPAKDGACLLPPYLQWWLLHVLLHPAQASSKTELNDRQPAPYKFRIPPTRIHASFRSARDLRAKLRAASCEERRPPLPARH